MEKIRLYLVSITSCAILCGLVSAFFAKHSTLSAVIKLLCGLVMTVVLLTPWVDFSFPDLESFWDSITLEGQTAAGEGITFYNESRKILINESVETYILDKAEELGLSVQVHVELSDTELPKPKSVTVSGDASPLLREKMTDQICSGLGITREHVQWK